MSTKIDGLFVVRFNQCDTHFDVEQNDKIGETENTNSFLALFVALSVSLQPKTRPCLTQDGSVDSCGFVVVFPCRDT